MKLLCQSDNFFLFGDTSSINSNRRLVSLKLQCGPVGSHLSAQEEKQGKLNWLSKYRRSDAVFQLLSHVWFCDLMDCSMPGFSALHYLPEFAQTHVCWVDDAIQPSCPLLSVLLLSSIFSSIKVFSNESVLCIRWPKYWSFSISSFNEYSGLISFKIDWFELLTVQGTLKSLLQYHSSKVQFFNA